MAMPRAAAANDSPSPSAAAVPAGPTAKPDQLDDTAQPSDDASLASANLDALPVGQSANDPTDDLSDEDDEPVFRITGATLGLR
jgi:hypothetical protein